MSHEPAGRIVSLWRYPISSLGGERLESVEVDSSGVVGDRVGGIFDASSREIADPSRAKRWHAMPQARSRLGHTGAIEVSTDGGRSWGDPAVSSCRGALSELFGFPAEFRRYVPVGEDGARPTYARSPIHLLTTAALRTLRSAVPQSVLDERRFRPNLLLDLEDGPSSIPEYGWIGRDLRVGTVILRGIRPCPRCSFTILQQADLPFDVRILRAITAEFDRNLGLYCEVLQPGTIRCGAEMTVSSSAGRNG